ncbi:hypothetical protein DL95DRAFT_416568 [Leptodontidium sp. 2 PMI_412]|nr:hypothetical protein DL95DRAFT_416568 [Leptodontidium sp. 2 PMI_412]
MWLRCCNLSETTQKANQGKRIVYGVGSFGFLIFSPSSRLQMQMHAPTSTFNQVKILLDDHLPAASWTPSTRLGPNSDVGQLAPRQVLIHIKKARNLFRSKSPYLLWKFGHQESIFDPLEMSTAEDAPDSNASYGPSATSNQSAEEN